MHKSGNKTICITGGTSGLGLELVKKFSQAGYNVITISREKMSDDVHYPNLRSITCDLSDFADVKMFVDLIERENIRIDILINNAGVLSPPEFIKTKDGFEFSYQVNFLSHFLITRLLMRKGIFNPELVVNVSSPIYKNGSFELINIQNEAAYKLFKAYASTKMYMALFSKKLAEDGLKSFSYNPGTFSSGIYRMQKPWFHLLYNVAAHFMAPSHKVADGMYRVIENKKWINGSMVNKKGDSSELVQMEQDKIDAFWNLVENQLHDWIN